MGAAVAERWDIESVAPKLARQHDPTAVQDAQVAWSARPIAQRLAVLRRARHLIASRAQSFAQAVAPALPRTEADTLVAELLPLLDACLFLERQAEHILRTRQLGNHGRPWWLRGLASEVQRVSFGQILIFAPSNYPLFLPGVHTLQALTAGNSVIWKPGRGGRPVADLFARALYDAGLPLHLLLVADDTVEAGQHALAGRLNGVLPGKVIFTGSVVSGRSILHALAETLTPCVAELSGCDAVIALPSACHDRLVQALCFGMRLNGSATCMAPRRLSLLGFTPESRNLLLRDLRAAFASVPPVEVPPETAGRLRGLLDEAKREGANVTDNAKSGLDSVNVAPVLVTNAQPSMEITRTDIFAPVLSVIDVSDLPALVAAEQQCPYALTVSIFGNTRVARSLAGSLTAGTILLNDIIVPTADPRVSFGGRRSSGYGATRGAEGLLEMTAPRTFIARTNNDRRHYEATGAHHTRFFEGIIRLSHAATWSERFHGLRQFIAAARNLR